MNKLSIGVLLILAFSIGYLVADPSVVSAPSEAIAANIEGKAIERISPQDHVKESQIIVLEDKVILDIKDVSWTTFTDTNSMDPLLDTGSNGIEIKPKSIEDIKIGDVISYHSEY